MSRHMAALRAKIGNDLIAVPSVTVLVFDEDGRVLLVRHAEGDVWVAPGGQIEPLEQPSAAALREVREETGLDVALTRLLGVYGGPELEVVYSNGDRLGYVMTVFEGEARSGSLRPDGAETLDARYFSRNELRTITLGSWVPAVLYAAYAVRERTDRSAGWS